MTEFSSKLPVWFQLAMMLRREILSGGLRPGAWVEPEVQLAARHGISVMPVRQALRSLEAEGLITRQRGRGTFVTQHGRLKGTTSLASLFSTQFERDADILDRGIGPVPSIWKDAFAGVDTLSWFRRVAYRDDRPLSYGTLYYLPEFDEQMTAKALRKWPIHRIMAEHYGVRAQRSHVEVQAAAADPSVARHLEIDPFSPVLSLSMVSVDDAGRAIGAVHLWFISDPHVMSFETTHIPLA